MKWAYLPLAELGTMVAEESASEGLLDNAEGQLKDIGTNKGRKLPVGPAQDDKRLMLFR